jgi:hypothetical protein
MSIDEAQQRVDLAAATVLVRWRQQQEHPDDDARRRDLDEAQAALRVARTTVEAMQAAPCQPHLAWLRAQREAGAER